MVLMPLLSRLLTLLVILTMPLFLARLTLIPIKSLSICFRRSEERFSRNAETDLVCRLLLEKKKIAGANAAVHIAITRGNGGLSLLRSAVARRVLRLRCSRAPTPACTGHG